MFFAPAKSRRSPATARSLPPVSASSTALLLAGCLAALLVPSRLQAQTPGQQDTTFISASTGSTIFALTLQFINPAPYVFLGGDLAALNQIDSSGADTTTFVTPDFGNPTGRLIYTIVSEQILSGETTPRLLVGGLFGRSSTQITAAAAAQNIVRLLPTGDLDTTFVPGRGADNFVTAILPLPDGGMVVGGEFQTFNNQPHERLVRLDHTGAIVGSNVFSSTLAFDNTILSFAAQVNPDPAGPQGQILVAGIFSGVNNRSSGPLVRLNADGTVDASFHPTFDDRVVVVTCQPDGKILAGGYFFNVNGVSEKHLVRLNYDGSVDTTFSAQVTNRPPLIAAPVAVNTITPLGDGRYYIGGNFVEINGVARNYLGRVEADGSVDDFDPGTAIINAVQQVAVDPYTNLVYVGETRSKSVNNVVPASLIRLFGDPVVPIVSIKAQNAVAKEIGLGEQPRRGIFRLRRTGDLSTPTTVYLTLSGTGAARIGTDYTIPTSQLQPDGNFYVATFPANESELKIRVIPSGIVSPDAPETIILTVDPDQSGNRTYDFNVSTNTATVTLKNSSQ